MTKGKVVLVPFPFDDLSNALRYAFATASTYGVCGYGPSGPCAHIRWRELSGLLGNISEVELLEGESE